MGESTLWTKIAAIGQVAAAIATFVAVWVSLWLAHTERRAHVKVRAGLRLLFAGDGSPFEDAIVIQITNCGLRPVRVASVGWRTGWLRRGPKWLAFQHAMQKFDLPISTMSTPTPPFDLGPGQEVTLNISPEPFKKEGEIRDTFFKRRVPWRRNPPATKICVVVFIVAAKAIVVRVEPTLEKFLATGEIANGADKANKAADNKIHETTT